MSNETNSSDHGARTIQPKHSIWRTYDGTDGLPSGAFCVLQDQQRYLWIGTSHGLCRFDGVRFINYTAEDGFPDDFVMSICEDSQGYLWFGVYGGGVYCYNGERLVSYATEDGLVGNRVITICENSQGRLWFGTEQNGVFCYDGEDFINYTTKDGLVSNHISSVCEDSQGRMWFGADGGASCYNGEQFINYTVQNGLAHNNVVAICEDSQERLWFCHGFTDENGASCYDGQRFINYTTEDGLAYNNVVTIYEDRQRRLWFGTYGGGVCCFDGSGFTTYTSADGLLDNRVFDMLQDREGSFWFIHSHSGLTRFDPETTRLLTEAAVSETLIQTREGALWFGDASKLCFLHKDEQRCQTFGSEVWSLLEDSKGCFWVGTVANGLYRYDSTDAIWEVNPRHFATEDGLNSNSILSVIEARDGTIWVGTAGSPGCLCRFDGSRFEAIQTPHPVVQRLLEDNYGRIWMGGWNGGGLSYYTPLGSPSARKKKDSEGEGHAAPLHNYTMKHGLPSDDVKSIVEDVAGRLWIGTRHGLCCFDGNQLIPYGERIPDHANHQFSVRDVNGQLWFGTMGNGVYRYDGRHFQQLTKADGLPSNSITGLVPQQDGSMIIGTYKGIAHYRPTATEPPRIEIREVVADQMYSHPSVVELTATGVGLVTIAYHGLSLSTHRMLYSYILEGHDKEWRDTWESQVRYQNLSPGEYTFRVVVINRDLVCSEAPATLQLTVVPDPRDEHIARLESELEERERAELELSYLRREVGQKYHFGNIIGHSVGITQVRALMERAIDSELTVLITGETGTGKELVAKAIHHNSSRKDRPVLDLNCGAVSKELISSTLFGHRKGAFTGAQDDQIGLFESASGGTVLLDEISGMPQDAQIHLLRVLEERKIQRLGEHVSRNVDVRIIAMTNQDLMKEVKERRFREDLYYRLSVFPIRIPPLRERSEDIPLLADYFLQGTDRKLSGFAPGVFEMLQTYLWPGNVRELRNAVHRAAALAEKEIQTYHFPPEITQGESLIQEIASQQIGLSASVETLQRRLIENALQECNGNHTHAARMLKMHRSNFVRLMKRLGVEYPDVPN